MKEEIIKFNKPTDFFGRNGIWEASGINISTWDNYDQIELIPITSKNKLASCRINIPKEHLQEFINKLQTFL